MQEDDNRDFDLYVRSMFEDAEEKVPSRIWNAVSSRMDVPERKPAIIWWRRAAVSAAAIAAIASGVFLIPHDSTLPNTDGAIEVVETAPTVSGLAQLQPSVPDALTSEAVPGTSSRESVTAKNQEPVMTPGSLAALEAIKSSGIPAAEEQHAAETPEVTVAQEQEAAEIADVPVAREQAEAPETVSVEVTVDKAIDQNKPTSSDPFDALGDETSGRRGGKFSFSAGGNAQTNTVSGNGISLRPFMAPGAVSVPEKTTVKDQGKSTFGIPVSVGLGVSYRFNPKWSAGVGVSATWLTRTFAGKYTEIAEDGTIAKTVTGDVDQTLLYVGVPVNVYFDVLKNHAVRFYTYGGGTIEKGLSNRYTIHDKSSDIHHKGEFEGLQFSAGLGMGVELKLVGGLGLYVDPSLRYYFDCNQPTSIRTEEPLMMTMDIGFRFNFK